MRRDVFVTATMDTDTAMLLTMLSEQFEGNRSMTVRQLVRAEAEAKGLTVRPVPTADASAQRPAVKVMPGD